jgi:hypothetical protein
MTLQWITPENVVAAAHYLLKLEKKAICESYQADKNSWVFSLHEELQQVLHHQKATEQKTAASWPNLDLIQYHLQSLIGRTKAFFLLLIEPEKTKLKDYLLALTTEQP